MSDWSLGRFYAIWYDKESSYEKVTIINFKADELGLGQFALACSRRGTFGAVPNIGIGALDIGNKNKALQEKLFLSSGEGPFVEEEEGKEDDP